MISTITESAVIELQQHEISDVVDVLQGRDIQYAISYEPGVAFLYGSEDVVEQVQDTLWAAQVVEGLGLVFGAEQFAEVDFAGAGKIEV